MIHSAIQNIFFFNLSNVLKVAYQGKWSQTWFYYFS